MVNAQMIEILTLRQAAISTDTSFVTAPAIHSYFIGNKIDILILIAHNLHPKKIISQIWVNLT